MEEHHHIAFDRYLHPSKPTFLPSSTKRKLEIAVRVVYTTAICLIATYFYDWGGMGTYISPVLSAMSSVLYFGLWQMSFIQIFHGTLIGGAIGVCIGYAYYIFPNPYILLALLFITLTIINSISSFDRLGKVFAALFITLGSLWPITSNNTIIGLLAFKYILLVSYIPFIITGLTLLLPYPALAFYSAKLKASNVCRKVSAVSIALIRGFCAQDFYDLYIVEFENLHQEIENEIESINTLIPYVEMESIFFPTLRNFVITIRLFIKHVNKLALELLSLKRSLLSICNNRTHNKFVQNMTESLEDISHEITISMKLLSEYFNNYIAIIYPFSNLSINQINNINRFYKTYLNVSNFFNCFTYNKISKQKSIQMVDITRSRSVSIIDQHSHCLWEDSNILIQNRINELIRRNNINKSNSNITDGFDSLLECNIIDEIIVEAEVSIDDNYSIDQSFSMKKVNYENTMTRLHDARARLVESYGKTRREYIWKKPKDYFNNLTENNKRLYMYPNLPVEETKDLQLNNENKDHDDNYNTDKLSDDITYAELHNILTDNHSLKHVNPRGAYVQRMIQLIDCINNFNDIYYYNSLTSQVSWSLTAYLFSHIYYLYGFTSSTVYEIVNLFNLLYPMVVKNDNNSKQLLNKKILKFLAVYSQPIKIALAITITSLLVVVKQFRDSEQNGFWAVVVICLIRQDNASSSFITAYQRILGTVIGSVYAFSMYEAMNCSSYVSTNKPTFGFSCGATNTIPVLLVWLGVCCYFREGPRYGYAALVAGFTPIVLLDGYVPGTSSGAWARVQKTIIGVFIYLIIDFFILPVRMDTSIRSTVLNSIDEISIIFKESLQAVQLLFDKPSESENKSLYILGSAKRKSMRQLELDVQDIAVDIDMNNDIDHQLDINTYEKCLDHLLVVDKKWKQFDLSQKKLSGMLKLVVYDPEIWHKPFPVQAYNNLNNNFKRLIESVNTLSQATRYLQAAMLKNDSSNNSKSSKSQLNSYEHMSHRIFTVVIRTTTALNMSREALQRLYHNDLYGDMTALITLSRYFDLLLNEIDEHFRIYLQTHPFDPKGIDISIVLTWQNVFEAECDLIKNISALGVTLHSVRNVEALSAI